MSSPMIPTSAWRSKSFHAVFMMILLGGSIVSAFFSASSFIHGRYIDGGIHDDGHRFHRHIATATTATEETPHEESSLSSDAEEAPSNADKKKQVLIVGAGWGGLSAAHALSKNSDVAVTVIEASPRVGGLVRDGFTSVSGQRPAEAGQHGFWENYHNVYRLLREDLTAHTDFTMDAALTDYAEQGQYSPRGLEAVWPVYQRQAVTLPTGLAQALYTRFDKLPLTDLATAAPLVLAFSEFDDSPEAWARYDDTSFRDLCVRLGVSKRCYEEAFEPMILTGLFAPGRECSAAAALGMAYFFVLKDQKSFDVRWCKGNIGRVIFDPWVKLMETNGVTFQTNTRVVGFELNEDGKSLSGLTIKNNDDDDDDTTSQITADTVVLAVGAEALNAFVRFSPTTLGQYAEFRRFANLRGTSVLATRIFLDRTLTVPFSANACWGFDEGVGMTVFDISTLHGGDADTTAGAPGSVLEVDYYHAQSLLVLDDDAVVAKVKADLDTVLGAACRTAAVVDAAVVRLPRAVNWYYPGSYKDMPDLRSESLHNLFFVGDIVRSRHGSWSQEKAFVTGMEAANVITGRPVDEGIVPLAPDEPHVAFGRNAVSAAKRLLGFGDASQGPSLVDFLVR